MRTSRNGILFIARREALVLTAYQDGPHMSIGFGDNDPSLKPGDTITVKEAFARLQRAIAARDVMLSRHIDKRGVTPTQQQYDACASLFYQAGTDNLDAVLNVWNEPRRDFAKTWLDQDVNSKNE